MSNLQVKVCRIDKILPHNNSDFLELCIVGGWQSVVKKGEFKENELVVYIPPDSVLPKSFSDKIGITKYLSNGVLRVARLRGENSQGLVIRPDLDWPIDTDVSEYYNIVKYEPAMKYSIGDMAPPHPLFPAYTEVENLRNFSRVLVEGEPVIVTEKIHGMNSRIGIIDGEFMAGSRKYVRKNPGEDNWKSNHYWFPLTLEPVRTFLEEMKRKGLNVVLYGELFGPIQKGYNYGQKDLAFRIFDIWDGNHFLDIKDIRDLHLDEVLDMVPILYEGPFSMVKIIELANGKTTFPGDHIREGVVIKPEHERHNHAIGRVILKYVSDNHLFGLKEDFTDA